MAIPLTRVCEAQEVSEKMLIRSGDKVWHGMVFCIPYFQKHILPQFCTLLKYCTK